MKIGVLSVTKRPHLIPELIRTVEQQVHHPHRWTVILHGCTSEDFNRVRTCLEMSSVVASLVARDGDVPLGAVRNEGFDMMAEYVDVLTTIDDDDYYGPGYLLDIVENFEQNPHAHVSGIQKYWIGWANEVDPSGLSIYGKWMSEGGQVIKDNRVSWVVDATTAIRSELWLGEEMEVPGDAGWEIQTVKLRYDDEAERGECEHLQKLIAKYDLIQVTRDPNHFCVVRIAHEDGYGGEHGHTWGPLFPPQPEEAPPPSPPEPPPPETPLDKVLMVVRDVLLTYHPLPPPPPPPEPQDTKPTGVFHIKCWKKKAGEKLFPKIMHGILVEDPKLVPGDFQACAGEHVLQVWSLGRRGAKG